MIDDLLRRRFKTPVDAIGHWLANRGVTALGVTIAGFAVGVAGCVAMAFEAYGLALVLLIANRLADLFDGAVARATSVTDFGGFVDIIADLLIYSGFVLGFAIGRPEEALPAAILIYTFLGTGGSFLAAANIAAKRDIQREPPSRKSFFYNAALAEGVETTIYLILICLFPDYFAIMTYIFAAISWVSILGHLLWARQFR
ncbi:CDP-alcohol phosphatidyltransferase family protein [Bauldia sp.]|uniref:CDP-alcohol phosphatidyltransferase family protein n=1 Tax=Bauldia sp. TaxID=2575872 RepID=UPI003BAB1D46